MIDIVSKNADDRRPMSRKNLLDTKATPAHSAYRHWLDRKSLARRAFNWDPPQLAITLPDP